MKVKNDFVTNSSSISFIIKWRRPVQIAKEMLEIFFREYENCVYTQRLKHEHEERVLKWISKNPKYEGNLYFPWSCNYETYIYLIDEEWFPSVRVDTCNNENWDINGLHIDQYVENYDYCRCNDDDCLCKDPTFKLKFLDLGDVDMKVKSKKQLIDERYKAMGYTRGPYGEDGEYLGYPSEKEKVQIED